jgi:hypothetical protein
VTEPVASQDSWPQRFRWATDPFLYVTLSIAAALRIPATWGHAMWRDEAQFAAVVTLPTTADMVRFLAEHESHPPLYYFLARGWVHLFGSTDAAFATLSFIWGMFLVVAVYASAASLWPRRAARLAALLAAASAPLIFNSGSARPYAFLGLMVLIGTWLAWRLTVAPSTKTMVGYVFVALVMLYSHHWCWLIVTAHGMAGLGYRVVQRSQWKKGWPLIWGLILVGYLPWLPNLWYQVSHAGHARMPLANLIYFCVQMMTGVRPPVAGLCVVAVALLAASEADDPRALATSRHDSVGLAFWGAVPVLVLGLAITLLPVANLMVRQVFTMLTPLVCVIVAAVVGRERVRWRWAGATTSVVLVLVVLYYGLSYTRGERTTMRLVADQMEAQNHGRGALVIVPLYLAPAFLRYYDGKGEVRSYPDRTSLSPVEYDDRATRGTTEVQLRPLLRRIDSAVVRGEPVWFLEARGMPGPVNAARDQLRAAIEVLYGPPAVAGLGTELQAFFELVAASLYTPKQAGATRTPRRHR